MKYRLKYGKKTYEVMAKDRNTAINLFKKHIKDNTNIEGAIDNIIDAIISNRDLLEDQSLSKNDLDIQVSGNTIYVYFNKEVGCFDSKLTDLSKALQPYATGGDVDIDTKGWSNFTGWYEINCIKFPMAENLKDCNTNVKDSLMAITFNQEDLDKVKSLVENSIIADIAEISEPNAYGICSLSIDADNVGATEEDKDTFYAIVDIIQSLYNVKDSKSVKDSIDLVSEIKNDPDAQEYISHNGDTCFRVTAPIHWYFLKCEQAGLNPVQKDDFLWEAEGNGFGFDWVEGNECILAIYNKALMDSAIKDDDLESLSRKELAHKLYELKKDKLPTVIGKDTPLSEDEFVHRYLNGAGAVDGFDKKALIYLVKKEMDIADKAIKDTLTAVTFKQEDLNKVNDLINGYNLNNKVDISNPNSYGICSLAMEEDNIFLTREDTDNFYEVIEIIKNWYR